MKIRQTLIAEWPQDRAGLSALQEVAPQLVLVFGSPQQLTRRELFTALRESFPTAQLAGCSSAGEILGDELHEHSAVVTAIHFDKVRFSIATSRIGDMADSRRAGQVVGAALAAPDLGAIVVLSQGVNVNGTALVEGICERIDARVPVSGGLAGDDGAFTRTWTIDNDGIHADRIVAIGFKRDGLRVSHGCAGGWQPFGPPRNVTRSDGNVLYEIDGEPALDIFKRYLGEHARQLPASALLFPFEMMDAANASGGLIRTVLHVNEADGSLVMAGDIRTGESVRLMHAPADRIVDGAGQAAYAAMQSCPGDASDGLALLVSCIGRKLALGVRTPEEIESVADMLGAGVAMTGFYSNGEISPIGNENRGRLHNATMALTWIGEVA